jgi:hypothetical protein
MSGRRRDELTDKEERWLILGRLVAARHGLNRQIDRLLDEDREDDEIVLPPKPCKPRRRSRASLALVELNGPNGIP